MKYFYLILMSRLAVEGECLEVVTIPDFIPGELVVELAKNDVERFGGVTESILPNPDIGV